MTQANLFPMEPLEPVQWPVIGHDWAIEFLRKSLVNQRTRHAYLISGTANIGKGQLAHAFAMALNCTHPDITQRPCGECRSCRLMNSGNHPDLIYSENDERTGQLKIDAIRHIIQMLALKPYDSRYRIAIMRDFDRARPQAQDALLKTLEEPGPYAVLILLAESLENVLPTITSRCQTIRLRPLPTQTVEEALKRAGATDDEAALLAGLSSGRIGWAINALHDETVMQARDEALAMLYQAITGNRAQRFDIADQLGNLGRQDKIALHNLLEIWQTYWRDVLLLAHDSPVKPCNRDRHIEIQQVVHAITPEAAHNALKATRRMLTRTLNTNANTRLAMEVLMLDYPYMR